MKLPRGAAGFGVIPDTSNHDFHDFAAICRQAARSTGGQVTSLAASGVTPDFHVAAISYPDRQLSVLRHDVLPLIALATPIPSDESTIMFIDDAELTDAITAMSTLQVLTHAELAEPVQPDQLSDLADDERQQIGYWRPQTIGQLLFNYWD